ncbi:MAG: hypothetical protein FJ388_20590 [Verrucomicrobia bacterium]|nr:hypothetical protein [Verrucomicrobiota bacterium]
MNVPWPSAGPYVLYTTDGTLYSHLMRAERHLLVWLEQNGYAYDMITELDLHRDARVLDGYKTVVISGHSEYWSDPMCEALDRYLRAGGTCTALSGNTMCWRVSFNPEGTIMECRKGRTHPGGRKFAHPGELWHSQDGRRGCLCRECNWTAYKLVGLEFTGMWMVSKASTGWLRVEEPDHFLFQRPEPLKLTRGDTFGCGPNGALPTSLGHETDGRLSFVRKITPDIPEGARVPEEPPGIVTLATMINPKGAVYDYFVRKSRADDGVVGHMIYWERPEGGRVFNIGSIAAGWGLTADAKLQMLLRNVLFHFGAKPTKGP